MKRGDRAHRMEFLRDYVVRLVPRSIDRALEKNGYEEPELELVDVLCGKLAIDVGAHNGLYVRRLLNSGARVIAFEPLPEKARKLKRRFGDAVELHQVALSSTAGPATLRVPQSDKGLSTLEEDNALGDDSATAHLSVRTATLDGYQLECVDFIKIDVEGHEEEVLNGAVNTIRKYRPVLQIEIEDRHRAGALEGTSGLLQQLDYAGFFLYDDVILPLSDFRGDQHQRAALENKNRTAYCNNFLFFPLEASGSTISQVNARLKSLSSP